jgi:CheY-like chemotaxis protein
MKKADTGRVLVVDDEIDVMTHFVLFFQRSGTEVGFTRGGCPEMLKKKPFDILLADFACPI